MASITSGTVDSKNRLPLPKDARDEVGWIKAGAKLTCWVFPGAMGGIQVANADSEILKTRSAILGRLKPPARSDEAHFDWFGRIRLLAACWETTIDTDGRLAIPAVIEDLALLDRQPGSKLAIIAYGSVLEIWNSADLRKHIDENRTSWRIAASSTDDFLGERSID